MKYHQIIADGRVPWESVVSSAGGGYSGGMSLIRLAAGAMSGTSADGVDVAIVRVEGTGLEMSATLLAHHYRPYDPAIRRAIFDARSGKPVALARLAELARQIALVYAAAVNEALVGAGLSAGDLACVAAHGQTLYHDPPLTIQWIDPALLAAEVGCRVVSDFRRADCAVGGQGAPLVPFADYILFRDRKLDRVLVNIGGIANLTYLPAAADTSWIVAFDTGPGNCISDWLMRRFDPAGSGYDQGGQRAARGNIIEPAVERMLGAAWFWQRPPKSTDGPAMIEQFQSAVGEVDDALADDLLATAAAITGRSIARAIGQFLGGDVDQVIVSGGGVHNAAIMRQLAAEMKGTPLLSSDKVGMRSEAKEAVAFALLGLATLDGVPGNIPGATGARRAVVLGAVTG